MTAPQCRSCLKRSSTHQHFIEDVPGCTEHALAEWYNWHLDLECPYYDIDLDTVIDRLAE